MHKTSGYPLKCGSIDSAPPERVRQQAGRLFLGNHIDYVALDFLEGCKQIEMGGVHRRRGIGALPVQFQGKLAIEDDGRKPSFDDRTGNSSQLKRAPMPGRYLDDVEKVRQRTVLSSHW